MVVISKKYDFRELLTECGYFGYLNSETYHGTVEMGTPTSWLFGGAPDGRLMGMLTFGQLFWGALEGLGGGNSDGWWGADKDGIE